MKILLPVVMSVMFLFSACGDDDDTNNVNNVNNSTNNTNNTNNTNTNNTNNTNTNNTNNTNTNNINNTNNTNNECIPGLTECSNCIDDDGDGLIDGFDPGCSSAADRLEGSFQTDIPGDDTNETIMDCWFDGNSGGGDDGCSIHVCCMLETCPEDLAGNYDPLDCESSITQDCIDNCLPYTIPGCDCFGCCTICVDGTCHDIFIGAPRIAPDCDQDNFDNPELCPRCMLNEDCGQPCHPEDCELCPGMTEDDLPPECQENTCPDEQLPCTYSSDCEANYYCSHGCCIPNPA